MMISSPTPTLALGSLGWQELVIVGIIGVLIFGRRLPEVGRNLGRSFVEFKKGLSGIDQEVKATADEAQRIAREDNPAVDTATKTEAPADPN